MKTTTAGSTINALSYVFGRYGLPEKVVSDNGPPFQSVEYEDVLRQN
jgi:transposase InsO family protein